VIAELAGVWKSGSLALLREERAGRGIGLLGRLAGCPAEHPAGVDGASGVAVGAALAGGDPTAGIEFGDAVAGVGALWRASGPGGRFVGLARLASWGRHGLETEKIEKLLASGCKRSESGKGHKTFSGCNNTPRWR